MSEKLYHREDYPFGLLAEYGLTEEMILDLPDSVHRRLEEGGFSPLLPIKVRRGRDYSIIHAKICLVSTDEGVSVLFAPKFKQLSLDEFSEEEKDLLLKGKAIVTNVTEAVTKENPQGGVVQAFVQLNKDCNSVMYVPTQIIGRNLSGVCQEFELEGESIDAFWKGDIVTIVTDQFEGEDPEEVSIGVDLLSPKGVFLVNGNEDDWMVEVDQYLPKYNFGNDGCWINNNGVLSYVPEDEFTDEINEEMGNRSEATADYPYVMSQGSNDMNRTYMSR